jgi:hypothetical protein
MIIKTNESSITSAGVCSTIYSYMPLVPELLMRGGIPKRFCEDENMEIFDYKYG